MIVKFRRNGVNLPELDGRVFLGGEGFGKDKPKLRIKVAEATSDGLVDILFTEEETQRLLNYLAGRML